MLLGSPHMTGQTSGPDRSGSPEVLARKGEELAGYGESVLSKRRAGLPVSVAALGRPSEERERKADDDHRSAQRGLRSLSQEDSQKVAASTKSTTPKATTTQPCELRLISRPWLRARWYAPGCGSDGVGHARHSTAATSRLPVRPLGITRALSRRRSSYRSQRVTPMSGLPPPSRSRRSTSGFLSPPLMLDARLGQILRWPTSSSRAEGRRSQRRTAALQQERSQSLRLPR